MLEEGLNSRRQELAEDNAHRRRNSLEESYSKKVAEMLQDWGSDWDLETQLVCAGIRADCETLLKDAGRRKIDAYEIASNEWEGRFLRAMEYVFLPLVSPRILLRAIYRLESPMDSTDSTVLEGQAELPSQGIVNYRLETVGHVDPKKAKEVMLWFPGLTPGLIMGQNHAWADSMALFGEAFSGRAIKAAEAGIFRGVVDQIKESHPRTP